MVHGYGIKMCEHGLLILGVFSFFEIEMGEALNKIKKVYAKLFERLNIRQYLKVDGVEKVCVDGITEKNARRILMEMECFLLHSTTTS